MRSSVEYNSLEGPTQLGCKRDTVTKDDDTALFSPVQNPN